MTGQQTLYAYFSQNSHSLGFSPRYYLHYISFARVDVLRETASAGTSKRSALGTPDPMPAISQPPLAVSLAGHHMRAAFQEQGGLLAVYDASLKET